MQIVIDIPEEEYAKIKESTKHNAMYLDLYLLMQRVVTDGTPLTDILDKIRAETSKSKTEHEMQIAERDIKAKLLISDIYCDIVNILDKYKAESGDK